MQRPAECKNWEPPPAGYASARNQIWFQSAICWSVSNYYALSRRMNPRKEWDFWTFQSIKRMNHGQQQSIHGRPGLCVYCLQDYFFLLLLSLRWRFVRAYCCRDMLSRPTAGAQQPGCEFQHIFFLFFFFPPGPPPPSPDDLSQYQLGPSSPPGT